jgi:DNA-binding NtrC family response regulator
MNPMSLLLVEDEDEFRESCALWMSRQGHHVTEAANGNEGLRLSSEKQFDVAVVDMNMPGMTGLELLERLKADNVETEIIILTGQATIDTAVQAMKLGACDYICKPFPLPELEQRCRIAWGRANLQKENRQLKAIIKRNHVPVQMIGESARMQQVNRLIERAAPSDKAILIQGESGTGKELVALALQSQSVRLHKPFVTINCAALPEQLVESELFGHEKGAFTGATQTKPGLFEVADGGTLFIDEIGELPLSLQPKLLRVLEDGSLRRVGSHKERRVNVRIIAATNRDLSQATRSGEFREDLYYRINVLTIELPPLRARESDIELLLNHFCGSAWECSEKAHAALASYSWPGNVRQLINVIDRAKILADDGCIQIDDLPSEVVQPAADTISSQPNSAAEPLIDGGVKLDDIERKHVVNILAQNHGNKAQAARALGIHRRKLYRLLERFNIAHDEIDIQARHASE